MVKKSITLYRKGLFLFGILVLSLLPKPVAGSFDVDLPHTTHNYIATASALITFPETTNENIQKRYIVYGSGSISNIISQSNKIIYGADSNHGSLAVGLFSQDQILSLQSNGYNIMEDLPLEFDSVKSNVAPGDITRIDTILGSYYPSHKYGFTGNGIKIGIVDTGTDFSNPDMQDAVARDKNNIPVMIDADGQGLVLTNATFLANIDAKGTIQNYTKHIPKNFTSSVYVNSKGVFLNLQNSGKGTSVQVYNSLYPKGGIPVLNGTVYNDYKIGNDPRHFIISKSGVYHFGMVYESVTVGTISRLLLVPVLVIDSNKAGLYDTIIPDMSDSWKDFIRFDQTVTSNFDYDFTDEAPITLGNGKEHLVYDSNRDGKADFSAGMVGAHVLDVYGVITNSSLLDKKNGAINGTLLPPLDPKGNFFGLMYDFGGHGTATASSIVSTGKETYDIFGNSTQYHLHGIAPSAKIVPIKALWLGDAIYGWMWAAGFDQENNHWKFSGQPRVDILSNSWGISTFPVLGSVPGLDMQSILLSALNIPHSLDVNYPGVLVVSSAGNAGPGYGTLGTPDAAPFGLTVGATTDNVFVGYGPFKNQPRFGNSTFYYGDVSGFSSKGPSLVGDPKPDLMGIGEYSYTPVSVTTFTKNNTGSFGLFGGTSLAAPLVAGSAAVLMQAMQENHLPYNPFTIKNILMSTATDLNNDPYTQGSGMVNMTSAINFVEGKDDVFVVYNDATYSNTKKVLDPAIRAINSSSFGLQRFQFTNTSLPDTPWFAGRLIPGERSTAVFTVVNPTNHTINLQVSPENLELIKTDTYDGITEPRIKDSLIQKSDTYRPNYIPLENVKNYTSLGTFFEKSKPIPNDAQLMILDLNFPFSQFMNSSSKKYADDMKISSLYLYDWNNKNNSTIPSYLDLSLVNRGGSWGTVQEVRVSDPLSKIKHTPVVGIYPVPTRYSYWTGDTKQNSTSINYTITASYYKKSPWNDVWLNSNNIEVPSHGTSKITATVIVPSDQNPGLYQGFITFKGKLHSVNVPVSYAVLKKLQPKDLPTVITGSNGDTLFGNGYISGGFDMSNRYNAGDWREYYFDVTDKSINSLAMNLSWKDPNTNLSVFVIDPQGRIIQTNVPAGVLGEFQGWPTGDWLGPSSPFSEGGGFYPVKNKNSTSTLLYAPINETGVYSVLVHTTLYGGNSITEPITIATKFSTILPQESAPQLNVDIPLFINGTYKINPIVIGNEIQTAQYSLDGEQPKSINSVQLSESLKHLSEGEHDIKFVVTDSVGHVMSKEFKFLLDNTPPVIAFKSPKNGSTISGMVDINIGIEEENPAQKNWLVVKTPKQFFYDNDSIPWDTRTLNDGQYSVEATATDKSGNVSIEHIIVNIDNSNPTAAIFANNGDQNFPTLLAIVIGIIIAASVSVITFKKFKISSKS